MRKFKSIIALLLSLFLLVGCGEMSQGVQSGSTQITTAGDLEIHYLDVGQADCSIIMLPTGENIIVDAGNRADKDYILNYINKLGIKTFVAAVATHPHEDHIGSMKDILENFQVDRIFMPDIVANTQVYSNLLYAIEEKGVEEIRVTEAFELNVGDSLIEVIGPVREYNDLNNSSIVFRLIYGERAFLFTGDIEKEAERDILNSGADVSANVLKVAHHGSKTSSAMDFINEVSPQVAIIQVGADNDYGAPNEGTVENLYKVANEVYRNDLDGEIVVKSDGTNVNVFVNGEGIKVDTTTATPNTQTTPVEEAKEEPKEEVKEETVTENVVGANFIGNKNSKTYHVSSCNSLPKEENRVNLSTKEEAEKLGYTPHSVCIK
ncbi:MAG: ComEC/Rec2 family competence protein [Anaerotignaceae bacterium]